MKKTISVSPISLDATTTVLKGPETVYRMEDLEKDREILTNMQKRIREILASKAR